MLGAAAITGYSLVSSLWPSLEGLSTVRSRILVSVIVVALHVGLAVSLGSYAFEPNAIKAGRIVAPVVTPAAPVVQRNTSHV